VIRTRVGYAGGTSGNPTYYNLDGHSETIEIDYDPNQVSYWELLELFWAGHSPTRPAFSRQYASIIFAHDEQQRRLAQMWKKEAEAQCGCRIYTQILPAPPFYLAEDYHQKYLLRQSRELMDQLALLYPDLADFVDSTAAARVNGYLGGHMTLADLRSELDDLGLSAEAQEALLEAVAARR
jgi:peptide-methionine (S)-S-oxide reductase